jgi:hypothetical protein
VKWSLSAFWDYLAGKLNPGYVVSMAKARELETKVAACRDIVETAITKAQATAGRHDRS